MAVSPQHPEAVGLRGEQAGWQCHHATGRATTAPTYLGATRGRLSWVMVTHPPWITIPVRAERGVRCSNSLSGSQGATSQRATLPPARPHVYICSSPCDSTAQLCGWVGLWDEPLPTPTSPSLCLGRGSCLEPPPKNTFADAAATQLFFKSCCLVKYKLVPRRH